MTSKQGPIVVFEGGRNDDEPEPVDMAHLPAVLEGLAEAKRREFATPARVEAAFRRFDGS